MESAHDHWYVAFAKFRCNLISTFCRIGFDADGDEVGWLVERDLLHAVVVKPHLDILGRQSGERGGGQRLPFATCEYIFVPAFGQCRDGQW